MYIEKLFKNLKNSINLKDFYEYLLSKYVKFEFNNK